MGMLWSRSAVGALSRPLLMASLTPRATVPSSVSIKHLPSEYHTGGRQHTRAFQDSGLQHRPASPQKDMYVQFKISEIFPYPQAELELNSAPTDHAHVSTSALHCNHLLRCLSFTHTHSPLRCEILKAFFKGRNRVTLISASLGLA